MKRLKDLPISSMTVQTDASGQFVDGLFKNNNQLSGVIVLESDGALQGVVSRSGFYSQMSRRTGFEIFANRPVTTLLEHISRTTLQVDPELCVSEAVEKCLEREPGHIYEPLLIRKDSGEYALVSFNELILAQSHALELTMEEIAEKNRQVHDSIRYAERIQNSMIFNEDRAIPKWLQYFTVYRPRDIVSGDFYWIVESDQKVFIAVADCTGHGVPGAFMSLIGHGHISSLVLNEGLQDPGAILTELHIRVRRSLHQESTSDVAYDGMEIGFCMIDPREHTIAFSGAKRPLMVANPDGKIKVEKGDRFPIGGKQKERQRIFTTQTLPVQTSATYYLHSDGYTDQSNPENRKFGTKRFKETLSHIAGLELDEQCEFLNKTLDLFQKGAPQRDDIAVLGFKMKFD